MASSANRKTRKSSKIVLLKLGWINCKIFESNKYIIKYIIKENYLGSPYKIRIAVTSHRLVSLYGSVIISMNLFPSPIFGLRKICSILSSSELKITQTSISEIYREAENNS